MHISSCILLCFFSLFVTPYFGRKSKAKYEAATYGKRYELERSIDRLERELAKFNARFMFNDYYNGDYDDKYYNDDGYDDDDEYYEYYYEPEVGDQVTLGEIEDEANKGFSHHRATVTKIIKKSPKPYFVKLLKSPSTQIAVKLTDIKTVHKESEETTSEESEEGTVFSLSDLLSMAKKHKKESSPRKQVKSLGFDKFMDVYEDEEIGHWKPGMHVLINGKLGKITGESGKDKKWPVTMDKTGNKIHVYSREMEMITKKIANYVEAGICGAKIYNAVRPFKIPYTEPLFGTKVVKGLFHATDEHSAKLIAKSFMKPGTKGWVDGGIYFATSPLAARAKAYAAHLFNEIRERHDDIIPPKAKQKALSKQTWIIKADVLVGRVAAMTGQQAATKQYYDKNGINKQLQWKDALIETKKDSVYLSDMKDGCYAFYPGMGLPQKIVEPALEADEWIVYYSSHVINIQAAKGDALF